MEGHEQEDADAEPGAADSASAGHLLGGSGRHHPLAVSINA